MESGTHTDLMRVDGLYRRLVERQFSDQSNPVEVKVQESASATTRAGPKDAENSWS
jgi:hypothetical protein